MTIVAAIPPSLYVQQIGKLAQEEQKTEASEPSSPKAETPQSSPAPILSAEMDEDNSESSKGVVRLLREGHFKGVADVRLRINFFDELAAIEQNQTRKIVSEKIDAILESVTLTLASGQLMQPPFETFIDPFEQALNESKENFLGAEVPSVGTLISDLESVFETLVASLAQTSASATAETIEQELPSIDGNEQEKIPGNGESGQDSVGGESIPPILGSDQDNPLSDPVARLRTAFSNEIDDLKNALGTTHILPELSEPTGNGVAYDKFLTIYNEMQTPRVPLDITSSTERLETKA